jgi:hypothetical protein
MKTLRSNLFSIFAYLEMTLRFDGRFLPGKQTSLQFAICNQLLPLLT